MKSFKYFDLNNNGTVEPEEFAKAIEKIGIMIPTRQVSAEMFIHGLGGARPKLRAATKICRRY
jgi:Ca2+-binding EF-hand superfamily protein